MRRAVEALTLAAAALVLAAVPAAGQAPAPTPVPTITPEPEPEPQPEPAPPPVVEATVVEDTVTGLFGGPTHASAVSGSIRSPLGLAWSAEVQATRLLAVPGTVVAVGSGGVVAFDAASGTERWTVAGPAEGAAIAHDVVIVVKDETLTAYALVDGSLRWTVGNVPRFSDPVPAGDLVLVQGLGSGSPPVRAFDVRTGAERWTADASNPGSPAVVGDRVYVPMCGGGFSVLDRRDGRVITGRQGGCSGGISYVASAVGRTVRIGSEAAFDAETMSPLPAVRWTAARSGLGLLNTSDDEVAGIDPVSSRQLWRAELPFIAGTNFLAGETAMVASREGVALLDAGSGALRWAGRFSNPVHTGSTAGEIPAIAALGSVFVVKDRTLLALRPGAAPPPARLTGTIEGLRVVQYGDSFSVETALTQEPIIVARDLVLASQAATSRRVRRRIVRRTTLDDSLVRLKLEPSRTTDYELSVAGGSGAKRFAAVVIPRERSRVRRGGPDGNAITARVSLRVPPAIRLGGRRFGLYVGRPGKRRYQRIATGTITRSGRGRGRVTVRFRAPRLGARDFFRSCVSGISRRGMGYHDRLDRSCGRPSVRF